MSDLNLNEKPKPEGSATKLEDFRLMCKLGEGTFSEVLKVKHKRTGQIYAMKRFRKHFNSYEEIEGLREILALRRLNPHPHIVDLEDVIFEPRNGVLSLNFELMDCNLYELISRKNLLMTESKAKMYMHQICKGLEYIHGKGIFHRDIKPENILVKDFNIKIADFGSCRGIHSKQPYTEYIATRWYRPPECLLCDGIYTYKMDIWSAGCVLYEVISKQPLFPGANELDQIHRIHNVMGTPSPKLLKQMLGSRASSPKFQFTPKEGTGIRSLLPYVSQDCVDIINALLIYNPDERISAKEALKHVFFKDINVLKANNAISQDSLQAIGKTSVTSKSNPKAEAPEVPEPSVSTTYLKTKDVEAKDEKPAVKDDENFAGSKLITVFESNEIIVPDTNASGIVNHQHRPKGKEVEPQVQPEAEGPGHKRKPSESEHVHLPAIVGASSIPHQQQLLHGRQSEVKQHHDMGHSKQHDEHKPSHQPKSEHPPEVLDLFVGQKPEVSQAHVPLYGAPKHNLSKDIPDNLHHLPHLTSTHANPAAQQHHQNQIQKQYQLQQAPPKVQYLQPLAQTISTNHHQMASDESMHQTQQATQRNDSDSSAISAKEANAQSRRRGANEKKAAEAVLARARRLQQIGGGGDIKRNPMLGHKVGRLHANGVVGVNDAARAENAVMFGVVGKIAPNNNATKFPVLSFAPPQSTMHTNIASNGQNNLPPLAHHDAELKPKHKFAQGHLPKESVLLPSLTDKNMLKLSVVPAVVEGTTSTNLPALRKKP